jgi:hypothetical protein
MHSRAPVREVLPRREGSHRTNIDTHPASAFVLDINGRGGLTFLQIEDYRLAFAGGYSKLDINRQGFIDVVLEPRPGVFPHCGKTPTARYFARPLPDTR